MQGDTVVPLRCICERLNDSDVKEALNLTGYTVTFTMTNAATNVDKIAAASATVVTAASGLVRYTFTEANVDTPGIYWGRFTASSGGAEASFPVNPTDLEIWIHGSDGTTAQEAYEAAQIA